MIVTIEVLTDDEFTGRTDVIGGREMIGVGETVPTTADNDEGGLTEGIEL